MNRATTSLADLRLTRYPDTQNAREPLRAWDAADEYLLRHVTGTVAANPAKPAANAADGAPDAAGGESEPAGAPGAEPIDLSGTVVALGDRWGSLVAALARSADPAGSGRLIQITDSFLTQQATRANLARLGIARNAVTLNSTTDAPPDRIDVLLIRVPKSLALLEDQLCRLARHIHAGTVVVGSGMVTEIHTSTLNLFDRIIGPTRTSLAVRKARLIFSEPDVTRPRACDLWPRNFRLPADVGLAAGRTVINHGGVFAGERLDIGARFLLRHLPWESAGSPAPGRGPARIADLGCGNGVLGLAAALAHPGAEITFVDESYQALASARATMAANGLLAEPDPAGGEAGAAATADATVAATAADRPVRARFVLQDGLAGTPPNSLDLVLNNPPFHTHQTTTDMTAWRMFNDAKSALRPGGELWAVGNRHLGYHVKLRRVFGNCDVVASDSKFVVLRAVKA
jgi:23S rRNA (guanine1835-N2)-methyltransferase